MLCYIKLSLRTLIETVSIAAMRRHRIRMKERFWETFQFKSQVVEELAKDLRSKVLRKDPCPEGLN